MCGRYSLAVSPEELEEVFEAPATGPLDLPRWNVAPTQDAPVVVAGRQGRRLGPMRWGLVPWFSDGPGGGARMINARAETVAAKPPFREAFARRRCLVPADGFYEWARRDGRKLPHWIHHHRGGLLAFAGLWERWRPPQGEGEPLHTFTILTTGPNRRVRPLHDRMPVVLPPEAWATWLDPEAAPDILSALLRPAPDDLLEARPVSPWVNTPAHDDARCIEPWSDAGNGSGGGDDGRGSGRPGGDRREEPPDLFEGV